MYLPGRVDFVILTIIKSEGSLAKKTRRADMGVLYKMTFLGLKYSARKGGVQGLAIGWKFGASPAK
jgi:hypothetical protein